MNRLTTIVLFFTALLASYPETPTSASDIVGTQTPKGSTTNSLTELIADNWRADGSDALHLVKPHGVPKHFSWYEVGDKSRLTPPEGFTSGTAWGQVYLAEGSTIPTNVRVHLSDFKTYLLMDDGSWELAQESKFEGSFFDNAFQDNRSSSSKGDIRELTDQSQEVRLDSMNHNYHFWMSPRMTYADASKVKGVYVKVDARLTMDDPNGVDNHYSAKLILNVGVDWWRTPTAEYVAPVGTNNPAAGVSRFKPIKKTTNTYHFTTVSSAQLRANPPPLD